MNGTWKKFTIIISSILAFVIVCTAVNITFDKLTKNISEQNTNVSGGVVDNGPDGQVVTDDDGQVVTQAGDVTTLQNGQQVTPNNNSSVPSNSVQTNQNKNPAQQQQQASANPTSYSKSQIISYYNSCLGKTYSQPKFTVTKTEVVDVKLGEMLLNGKPATGIQSLTNRVVEANKKKNGTKTKSFTSSNVAVDAQERFILPANLYTGAVKNYSVQKSGSGYVINFTLNSEQCDFRTKPPYNSSCTFPLDFTEIDLGGIGEITSAQFYYPGTTLQVTIDGQGRVVKTYVVMPLTVDNAKGAGMGQELQMDISGQWLCTNSFSF